MKLPLVTVAIRSYNSQNTIAKAIQSAKDQTYKNIEIIVADNHSRDKSVAIAKSFGIKVIYFEKYSESKREVYAMSKGKYLLLLDSDQIAEKDVVKKCVNICEGKPINAVIISEKSIIQKGTLLEKLIAYDKWVLDQNKDSDELFGVLLPRFFKKQLLDEFIWPKGLIIFDDIIIYAKLLRQGARVTYLSDAHLWHHEVSDWKKFVIKWYRYGRGYFKSLQEQPKTTLTHSLPRRVYFSKSAMSRPHYFLGLMFLYAVKTVAGSIGVLSYIISPKETNQLG